MPHHMLFEVLKAAYSLTEDFHIYSYLGALCADISFYVSHDSSKSNDTKLSGDLLQVCSLSPILFITGMFINSPINPTPIIEHYSWTHYTQQHSCHTAHTFFLSIGMRICASECGLLPLFDAPIHDRNDTLVDRSVFHNPHVTMDLKRLTKLTDYMPKTIYAPEKWGLGTIRGDTLLGTMPRKITHWTKAAIGPGDRNRHAQVAVRDRVEACRQHHGPANDEAVEEVRRYAGLRNVPAL